MKTNHGSRLAAWSALMVLAGLVLGAAPPAGSAPPVAALPTISGADIPAQPSSPPKAAEWKAATPVRIHRGDQGPCSASLLREWLRLRCPGWIGGGLVAGDPKGVTISTTGNPLGAAAEEQGLGDPSGVNAVTTLVLPLRRGEAKVVSFLQFAQEYNSIAAAEAGILSVVWRSGKADPVLIMTRRPEPSMF